MGIHLDEISDEFDDQGQNMTSQCQVTSQTYAGEACTCVHPLCQKDFQAKGLSITGSGRCVNDGAFS